MKEGALHDAKNRLSAIVHEVEETGGEIVITRHGKPVARLLPVRIASTEERAALIERILYVRDNFTDAGQEPIDWRELRDAGRKY
ncbi:MAG: type II toxin-antitoxin system Phd/YefM family antitoxin [Proteobacteria bacterium]|nr:type II toxin-antitoxin system Phd/YefM family antitoxin [Pseudomonadota bacterium]